ncbi:FadR/GntR family transcriptional regulator [Egicoccus sp. AB-alg6-2]|uniref:FadR/GntR family transcriptional regulator n=1 Tax=Egicoccus sp. AB-alg6-2 TaxID=3242692 RepID=UPI00359CDB0C
MRVGDRLPVERELREGLGVSRSSVRDGVRALQAMGLVGVRIGAKGGAFVTCPQPDLVSELLHLMLTLSEVETSEVSEARALVELSCLPLVCRKATPADLDALRSLCEPAFGPAAPRGSTSDGEAARSFHVRLAEASHSSVLPILLATLSGGDGARCAGSSSDITRDHVALLAAITDRDVPRAQTLLAEHLGVDGRVATVALELANAGPRSVGCQSLDDDTSLAGDECPHG